MKVCPYSYFRWCGYFQSPWVSFVTTDEFSVSVTKITSRIGVSWTHSLPFCFEKFLTQWIMTILSKGCKPDNFEPHNSLKLSFTNIWGLRSNFVECESFLESNSPDILALYETNLDDSIDSGNFSVGVIFLIRKDFLAVYVKEGVSFTWDLSLENSADSFLWFWLSLLYSVSYLFFFILF